VLTDQYILFRAWNKAY